LCLRSYARTFHVVMNQDVKTTRYLTKRKFWISGCFAQLVVKRIACEIPILALAHEWRMTSNIKYAKFVLIWNPLLQIGLIPL
jgi:hypothetical protein